MGDPFEIEAERQEEQSTDAAVLRLAGHVMRHRRPGSTGVVDALNGLADMLDPEGAEDPRPVAFADQGSLAAYLVARFGESPASARETADQLAVDGSAYTLDLGIPPYNRSCVVMKAGGWWLIIPIRHGGGLAPVRSA